jgi:hypothetical protein
LLSFSALIPELASQTPVSSAGRARFRPAACRHPRGEGPVYDGVAGFAAIVVVAPVVTVGVRVGPLLGFFVLEGSVLVRVGRLARALVVDVPADVLAAGVVAWEAAWPDGVVLLEPLVAEEPLAAEVEVCAALVGVVPARADAACPAVWPDAVVTCADVETLFV